MPLGVRLKYLAPQVVLVGSRHPRLRRRVSPPLHYTIIGIALEMARGTRALHYHLYALAPLVPLAEFGEANDLDLYAHASGAIHRLVSFSVGDLQDTTPFAKATGVHRSCQRQ